MALLTNINGKFSVSDAGAVRFNDAFTFPTLDGTANYFLQTNGSGQLAWAAGPTGTVKGTGTATRVAFWSANDTISSSADLYWDNTNKRLGIGVAAPAALLEINGTGDAIRVESTNTGAGGAQVDLLHFSPSPADNDTMGYINMGGYYSGTSSAYFSSIRTVATDISAREGEIQFWTIDTTLKQRMVIDKNGNVGIGNEGTGVVLTGKGLGIQNIGQDTTASIRLTGHNATGNPGVATFTELKHYGDTLSFGINHNGGTDVMTINSSKQVTFSGLVSGITPTAAANFATKAYVDAHPGGTVTGTGAASRVAYWTTTSNISYNDDFKYDGFRKIALGGDIETSLSDFCSIELGNTGMIMSEKADSQYNALFLSNNTYYTDAWRYKTASVVGANYISLYQGKILFATAPAPTTAGDAITWSTKMTILNSGNVGIGTTGPPSKLTVMESTLCTNSGTDGGTSYVPAKPILLVTTDGNGTPSSFYGTNSVFTVGIGGGITGGVTTEHLRVNLNGNVGIGTSSPTFQLSIENHDTTTSTATMEIDGKRTNGTDGAVGEMIFSNNGDTFATVAAYRDTADNKGALYFQTQGASGFTTKMIIRNSARIEMSADVTMSGSVGIGETTLQRKFNLYDGTDTWTRVRCGASTADWLHGIAGSDHTYKWYNQSSNGGVGNKMALATSGALTVSSDVVAYGSPSDKRLKENIKPIESALDKAMKLQGVTFDWKESDSILKIKEDIGFIAQDVQKVIPELVRENEDGMLSMRHQGIAPILLEAIKELKAEIEELKLNNCNCK